MWSNKTKEQNQPQGKWGIEQPAGAPTQQAPKRQSQHTCKRIANSEKKRKDGVPQERGLQKQNRLDADWMPRSCFTAFSESVEEEKIVYT